MKLLRRLHLYLGCIFAPALIFFAVTGAWQLYRMHDTTKDRSYVAPASLQALSAIHMNSHLPGKRASEFTPMRIFSTLAAAGLVITTALGVLMAFKMSRNVMPPLLCIAAGVVVPALFLYVYR